MDITLNLIYRGGFMFGRQLWPWPELLLPLPAPHLLLFPCFPILHPPLALLLLSPSLALWTCCNSYTMQFIHLNHTGQWLYIPRIVQPSPHSIFQHFITTTTTPHPRQICFVIWLMLQTLPTPVSFPALLLLYQKLLSPCLQLRIQ